MAGDSANRRLSAWLADLIGNRGRLGDGFIEIPIADAALAERMSATLRTAGIEASVAPAGLLVSGEANLRRLLQLLPLPIPSRGRAAPRTRPGGRRPSST